MAVAEEVTVVPADKVVLAVLVDKVVGFNISLTLMVTTTVTKTGVVLGVHILITIINVMTGDVAQFINAIDTNTLAVVVEVPVAQEELAVPVVLAEMVRVITNLNLMVQVVQLVLMEMEVLAVLAEVPMLVPEEMAVLADKAVPEVLVETVELSVITEVLAQLAQLVQLETLVVEEITETTLTDMAVQEDLAVQQELVVPLVELKVIT